MVLLLASSTIFKEVRRPLNQGLLPSMDLARVDFKPAGQLCNVVLPLERGQSHFGLEDWAVLLTCLLHVLLLSFRPILGAGLSLSHLSEFWGPPQTAVFCIYYKPRKLIWGANAKDKADPIRIEKAFPAIISKAKSQRVNRLMRSRAPKIVHPRRVGSTYLLSGLVKCYKCNRALSGQDAKSGQFSYYVCQSIMKRGKDACETPRLNARRFEEFVIGKIRSNVLTDGNIRALVKVVDEQMDGVAREQRKRLETIEDELEDVKRKLGRIWHFVETTDIDMADACPDGYTRYRSHSAGCRGCRAAHGNTHPDPGH